MEWPAAWKSPARLELVRRTPINCLLCPSEPSPEFAAAATEASIDCLPPNNSSVAWRPLKEIDWRSPAPVIGISDGVWPGLDTRRGGTSESAGPTGTPWLDANGWIIQLARCRARGKPVWVRAEAPPANDVIGLPDYLLAIHEARVYGARRPLWLSPAHIQELDKGTERAKQGWLSLAAALAWWRKHTDWQTWSVDARLMVVSDFSGPNEYFSTEILNLAARRDLAFRAATPDQVTAAAVRDFRAVLYAGQEPPPPEVLPVLGQFAASGGLLLASQPTVAKLNGLGPPDRTHPRFTLYSLGKGRVAEPVPGWDDPWQAVLDTHLLMSRRYDSVRLFNGGSLSLHHQVAPDGSRSVVHLLNYARHQAAHQVLLQSQRPVRAARILDPAKPDAAALTVRREMGRYEMPLPPFAVYAAVELEHKP